MAEDGMKLINLSRAFSHVNARSKTNISETSSVSIIRADDE
jgi:hypothetical protein